MKTYLRVKHMQTFGEVKARTLSQSEAVFSKVNSDYRLLCYEQSSKRCTLKAGNCKVLNME